MGEKSLADPQQAFSTLALYAASQVVHSKLWALEYFIHPNHVQTKTAPMLRSVSRDERAGFVSYKGLLKIKPCCWKSRLAVGGGRAVNAHTSYKGMCASSQDAAALSQEGIS